MTAVNLPAEFEPRTGDTWTEATTREYGPGEGACPYPSHHVDRRPTPVVPLLSRLSRWLVYSWAVELDGVEVERHGSEMRAVRAAGRLYAVVDGRVTTRAIPGVLPRWLGG